MDPYITVLQRMVYSERSVHVGVLAEGMAVTRQTLSAWVNAQHPIPLFQARKLCVVSGDLRLGRAMLVGTGLRVMSAPVYTAPFFLIIDHAAVYSKLLEIAEKVRQGTLTQEEREKGQRLVDEFRTFTDQIESVLNEKGDSHE